MSFFLVFSRRGRSNDSVADQQPFHPGGKIAGRESSGRVASVLHAEPRVVSARIADTEWHVFDDTCVVLGQKWLSRGEQGGFWRPASRTRAPRRAAGGGAVVCRRPTGRRATAGRVSRCPREPRLSTSLGLGWRNNDEIERLRRMASGRGSARLAPGRGPPSRCGRWPPSPVPVATSLTWSEPCRISRRKMRARPP